MAKDNKFNLDGFEQLPDGSYQKKKTVLQPREIQKSIKTHPAYEGFDAKRYMDIYKQTGNVLHDTLHPDWEIEFPVDPMGKPRMTQQDKWKKRPATDRYWQLKDNLKKIAEGYKFVMPESNYHMIFYIPMPDSWPKAKKELFNEKPHQQKPDKDNLEKAVLDSLCKEDSYIWDGRVSKYWAYKGKIVIKNL